MPILTVEIVVSPSEKINENFASQLAQRAGEIFASGTSNTWVKVFPILQAYYAENDEGVTAVNPIFVSVLKAHLPDNSMMAREVKELTTAVATLSQRPTENIHIIYLPEGNGRVAFGGKLVGS